MNGIWSKLGELVAGCGIVIAVWAIIIVIIGYPIKWLWNCIMPALFGLPEISFWMAVGITLLASILFGKTVNIKNKE